MVVTVRPTSGEAAPVPWIAEIGVTADAGGVVVVGGGGEVVAAVGDGAPVVKSALLSAVFAKLARLTEVVFDGAGLGPVPAKDAPPP